jgi:hypothetical protein
LEVDVQQGNFKILWLLLQTFILFLVEKWNPPTRSKIVEIGQKIEGILGVNLSILNCVITHYKPNHYPLKPKGPNVRMADKLVLGKVT